MSQKRQKCRTPARLLESNHTPSGENWYYTAGILAGICAAWRCGVHVVHGRGSSRGFNDRCHRQFQKPGEKDPA